MTNPTSQESIDEWFNKNNMTVDITSATVNTSPVYTVSSYPNLNTTTFDYSNITWAGLNDNITGASLEVQGTANFQNDANFQGDVKIKGKSIVDSLERIEERLAILRPNEELEEKWDKLRDLRKAYIELEAEIKEKELIWATLKK